MGSIYCLWCFHLPTRSKKGWEGRCAGSSAVGCGGLWSALPMALYLCETAEVAPGSCGFYFYFILLLEGASLGNQ